MHVVAFIRCVVLVCVRTDLLLASVCFFFQAEDGIRYLVRSRGLGDVYKRQTEGRMPGCRRVGVLAYAQARTGGGGEGYGADEFLSLIHI